MYNIQIMKRTKLTVEERKITGKKVKKLRREGILPANVYGKNIKSISVQVKDKDFAKAYSEAGETGLVDVDLKGKIIPVLIHNVQKDPVQKFYIHADFYKVDLTQKVKTMVPLSIVGQAKAVVDKLGLLLQPLSQVEVEALPEDLPEKIEVNVEALAEVGQQITVGEIKPVKGVAIITDPSQVVVKIGELVSKEAQAQAAAEAAAAEAAKAATAAETAPAEEGAPATQAPTAEAGKSETAKAESPKPQEAPKAA